MKRYELIFYILITLIILFILGTIWFGNPQVSLKCARTAFLLGIIALTPGFKMLMDWMES